MTYDSSIEESYFILAITYKILFMGILSDSLSPMYELIGESCEEQ
jgi:hypothetical protein